MTRSTSAVAVCCSSASLSARSLRCSRMARSRRYVRPRSAWPLKFASSCAILAASSAIPAPTASPPAPSSSAPLPWTSARIARAEGTACDLGHRDRRAAVMAHRRRVRSRGGAAVRGVGAGAARAALHGRGGRP